MPEFPPSNKFLVPPSIDWEVLRKRGIAVRVEDLPELAEGYARGVHMTARELVEQILDRGLDYSRQGMLMSTARIFREGQEVEYTTDDPRFAKSVDIVFDLPFDQVRLHNDISKSPGLIPSNQIIGVIDPYRIPETSQR